ncbi:VOC family protein [Agilicoccus flavus]|uniref:VOC family protein n=1 Tax=Agilicoccus flavus TaxID=2775968 RepID=UPI001CF6DAA3|nr:VOC family protein [Agilicoccus flavus]
MTTTTRVFPAFQSHDPDALLAFLTGALGFVENTVHRDDDGVVVHAQVDWPGGGAVMFGRHRPDQQWCREPGTAGVYLVASDIDAVHERARAAGADVARGLEETDYGAREFTVRDPEGNLWSIGTYEGEPPAA